MKPIIRFKANDGAIFGSISECRRRDELIEEVDKIMSMLPPRPDDDGCKFSNGRGYIQHDKSAFMAARHALLELANKHRPHNIFRQAMKDMAVHSSWPSRIICDDDFLTPLCHAWTRFACTDSKFREWGQPYFADHPDEAKHIAIQCDDPT